MNKVIKIGVTLGIVGLIISMVLMKLVSPGIIFTGTTMVASMLIFLILLILLGRYWLYDDNITSLTYGEALKYLFIASLIAGVISVVSSTILYQNDQSIIAAFDEYAISSQETGLRMGMKMAGASESQINEELDKLADQRESGEIPIAEYPFQFSKIPINIFMQIIMSLMYALIAAIFVKKKG